MINILGLTVGIAASLLILLWVQDEVRRDQFHPKSENIYQVWRNMYQASGEISTTSGIPQPLELVLRENYPEIEEVTLLSYEIESLFRIEEEKSYEIGRYASPEFFNIFSFPFIIGDSQKALKDPHCVVISQSLAQKYFGEDWKNNTLGHTSKLDERQDFQITGVFKKLARILH